MLKRLPEEFRQYFWDVNFDKIDTEKSYIFVISRVLDRGNTDDVKWLIKNFGSDKIKEALMKDRGIDVMTGRLWSGMLDIDPNMVPCLLKPYSPIHFGLYS